MDKKVKIDSEALDSWMEDMTEENELTSKTVSHDELFDYLANNLACGGKHLPKSMQEYFSNIQWTHESTAGRALLSHIVQDVLQYIAEKQGHK